MTAGIPESHQDLFGPPVHAVLATKMPDGQPQLTVVWTSWDGEYVYINTARGRQKERNMSARPEVTVFSMATDDPYHWIEVRGKVVEMTEEGAAEHIDVLARAYEGRKGYFGDMVPASMRDTMVRVICKIEPIKVNTH